MCHALKVGPFLHREFKSSDLEAEKERRKVDEVWISCGNKKGQ
jgi:hypothetical protein